MEMKNTISENFCKGKVFWNLTFWILIWGLVCFLMIGWWITNKLSRQWIYCDKLFFFCFWGFSGLSINLFSSSYRKVDSLNEVSIGINIFSNFFNNKEIHIVHVHDYLIHQLKIIWLWFYLSPWPTHCSVPSYPLYLIKSLSAKIQLWKSTNYPNPCSHFTDNHLRQVNESMSISELKKSRAKFLLHVA